MAEIVAITVANAEEFLKEHGRHYKMPAEVVAAIGLAEGDQLHGAAILGRTAEGHGCAAHIYVDGAFQGYTLLYGACWRALHALGYDTVKL